MFTILTFQLTLPLCVSSPQKTFRTSQKVNTILVVLLCGVSDGITSTELSLSGRNLTIYLCCVGPRGHVSVSAKRVACEHYVSRKTHTTSCTCMYKSIQLYNLQLWKKTSTLFHILVSYPCRGACSNLTFYHNSGKTFSTEQICNLV